VTVDGEWQFKGWLGDEWRWHVAKPWDAPGWLPARVPGSVVDDLVRAGEAPSPYFERNSRCSEWAAARTWIYRTRVEGARTLEFGGVDHEATVFIDGDEVAHHVGAFTPFRVEVPDGAHLLAVAVHAAPESEAQVGRTSRVRVHKSRMGYGWDFCPRLVHQGIWRGVGEPRSYPRVTFDGAVGRVELNGELLLEVERPELWWPNGMGEQRLYRAGEFEVGFRTLELADDYTLLVNGRAASIRGWNWVPLDVLYGVPRPEKLAHLLGLAQRAGVNLLRVWGGGVIESDEFYGLCDRLGLVVWQEFIQSSSGFESKPSDDPDFVATLAADAREIVPSRAHHPSLAIWCGGNELDADDSTPAIAALRDVVLELDPARSWLPTSPIGERDVHGPWEHQGLRKQYEHYDTRTSLLHSEFGVEGMTNRRALEELVAEEHRWPADRTNPVYEHLGAWWNNAPFVQEAFGGRLEDLDTLRRASQWLQYEGLRYAVEATIRRGAGVIPWQFNESFPNAWCTSAVDWFGEPKPAYYGVARAYRGAPSAQLATCAWGGLGEVRAAVGVPARLLDLDGSVVAEGEGEVAAPLDAFAHDIFLLDLGGNRYVLSRTENLAPLLDLPRTTLVLEKGEIRNTGDVAAIGVVLEADDRWAAFDDNAFDLLPGESRAAGPATRAEGWNARV
jgi:beta-mannosidase